ncbi:hypothetical protein GFGA_1c0431 [Gluconobacter frateurii NBRC 103465]|nr:hypothetical protein GFGA_1c0431 [Gluconobacter frateurii NBRC 103465]
MQENRGVFRPMTDQNAYGSGRFRTAGVWEAGVSESSLYQTGMDARSGRNVRKWRSEREAVSDARASEQALPTPHGYGSSLARDCHYDGTALLTSWPAYHAGHNVQWRAVSWMRSASWS